MEEPQGTKGPGWNSPPPLILNRIDNFASLSADARERRTARTVWFALIQLCCSCACEPLKVLASDAYVLRFLALAKAIKSGRTPRRRFVAASLRQSSARICFSDGDCNYRAGSLADLRGGSHSR